MQSQHDIHEVLSILRKLQDSMGPTAMKLTAAVTLRNPNTRGALVAFPSQNLVHPLVLCITYPTLTVLWRCPALSDRVPLSGRARVAEYGYNRIKEIEEDSITY